MILGRQSLASLGSVLVIVGVVSALTGFAQAALASSTITLEQPIQFTGIDGSDVLLSPGTYQVDQAESWLKVVPHGGQPSDAVLIQAVSATHEETLDTPVAVSTPGDEENVYHLVLLLPEGKALDAMGSYSGIRTRGLGIKAQVKTFVPAGSPWRKLPGKAKDIGVGPKGSVWIIGNKMTGPGGYSIHHLQNGKWQTIPGGAVRIAVGPQGTPWVVGKTGNIYRRQGTRWQHIPGKARDIGVGPKGSVWIIGNKMTGAGGYSIHHLQNEKWRTIPGGAVRIAVGPQGTPWVVGKTGNIYQRQGTRWQHIPGKARDIGVGADGSVWIIGWTSQSGGYAVYHRVKGAWRRDQRAAVQIAVGPQGIPWTVNKLQDIFTFSGTADRLPDTGGVTTHFPSGRFTTPAKNATIRGLVHLDVAATATHGIANVQIQIDNKDTFCSLEKRAPYTCDWDTTNVSDGQHTLSAVITDTKNQRYVTVVPVIVFNKIGTRPPGGPVSGDGGLKKDDPPPPPQSAGNCRPRSEIIDTQYGALAPAIAVFQNRLHVVTAGELPIDDGTGGSFYYRRVHHYIRDDSGNWSGPVTINKGSASGVALATFEGKLHMVHRTQNLKLYQTMFDGVHWSSRVRIPSQTSYSRPALVVFQNKLHLVYVGDIDTPPGLGNLGHFKNGTFYHSTYRQGRWASAKIIQEGESFGPDPGDITSFYPPSLAVIEPQRSGGRLDMGFRFKTFGGPSIGYANYDPKNDRWVSLWGDLGRKGSVLRGLGEKERLRTEGGPTLISDAVNNVLMLYRPSASKKEIHIIKRIAEGRWTNFQRILNHKTKSPVGATVFQGCVHTVHVKSGSNKVIHSTIPVSGPYYGQQQQ